MSICYLKNQLFTTITKKMAEELLKTGKTIGTFKKKDGTKYKQYILLNKSEMKLMKGEFII